MTLDLFDAPAASSGAPSAPCDPTPAARVEVAAPPVPHGHHHAPAESHERELVRLEPVALIAGESRHTFTAADVRDLAEKAGILTGEEGRPDPNTGRLAKPRALAYLGALLPRLARLGLVEPYTIDGRKQYAESERARANGNKQVLWTLTPDGRAFVTRHGTGLGSLSVGLTARRAATPPSRRRRVARTHDPAALAGQRP